MNRGLMYRCVVGFAVFVTVVGPAQSAPTAKDIMLKVQNTYKVMKSYQAVWQMDMSMGQMGSMSMMMDVKMIPGKKSKVVTKPNGQGTGMMAMGSAMATMQMTDDGKNAWSYIPSMNSYMKSPSQASNKAITESFMGGHGGDATYSLLPSQRIAGKTCYVILATHKSSQSGMNSRTTIFIDQASYRFIQAASSSSGQMGAGAQKMDMKMTMVVKSETVNAPIPPSTFVFTKPAGAKEMNSRAMGMPGMGSPRPRKK